jgi:hypothetical protein
VTAADETRAIVAALTLEANQLVTGVTTLMQKNEELAAKIRGVQSHNLDLATAGGLLDNSINDDLRGAVNRYRLVIQILEQYSGKVL